MARKTTSDNTPERTAPARRARFGVRAAALSLAAAALAAAGLVGVVTATGAPATGHTAALTQVSTTSTIKTGSGLVSNSLRGSSWG